jgi:hypothetical protein
VDRADRDEGEGGQAASKGKLKWKGERGIRGITARAFAFARARARADCLSTNERSDRFVRVGRLFAPGRIARNEGNEVRRRRRRRRSGPPRAKSRSFITSRILE